MIELRKLETEHTETHVLEGGSGPDLVFLHSAGGVRPDDPFLLKLSESYRVHAPLLPGYGESPECTAIRDMLDVTLHTFDVVEKLGLSKPILVGHSLGGMIAAEMAAVCPNEVDRLCLIAAAGLWLDEYPSPDLFAMLPGEFPEMLFHDVELGRSLITSNVDIKDPKFLIPFLVDNARQLGMAGKLLFPIPERGLKDRLYRIKARTVLVWGDSDKVFPAPYAQAFKAQIRGAELLSVPDAGHAVTAEKPETVIAAIRRL
ncbi:MAG: alpha/beta hydrolase [Alphaproteobacteria bacterium]|nr:alpha/beta hydrolase [Alphaproteobacteria bacterium]